MRLSTPGVTPSGELVTISVGGRALTCRPGDTIAAALTDAGELHCRLTSGGAARGLFCGMGVCHECVMEIDGLPRRACMTAVRDGMIVELHPARALPQRPPPSPQRAELLEPELLVIGGGPGGLAAAAVAAEAGSRVVLIDERTTLGGQYFKQPAAALQIDEAKLDLQYRKGRELIQRVERAGVRVVGATVWAATPDELLAISSETSYALRPARLILATGAYERAVPFPGWTLPGVMTTGAAQTLMRAYQVLPGRRVLVSGNGPLNLQVAAELARAGCTVAAVCELAPVRSAARIGSLARMASSAPGLVRTGAWYLRMLRRAGVPTLLRHAVVRVEGEDRVRRAVVARLDRHGRPVPGSAQQFDVDAVCVGFGFLPSNEIARSLGLKHTYDTALAQLRTTHDERGRTSSPLVWVIGDGGGTGGALIAQASGTLAGLDVADSLGRHADPSLQRERRAAARLYSRSERFQRGLAGLYRAPRLVDQLAERDTPVCRCEGVTLAAAEAAFAEGTRSIGAVKRLTRAGMGRCQGRYCAPVLAELAARRFGYAIDEAAWFAPAPPFKPVPVGLAATAMLSAAEAAAARTD